MMKRMMKRMMRGVTLMVALMLMQAQNMMAQTLSGEDFLKSLEGTYIELFSSETCLNPQYDTLWKSEARKYVGEEKADDAIRQLVGGCQGTRTGKESVEYFKQHGGMQFCCHFLQGVGKITFKGNQISAVDKEGKKLFSHKYRFVGKDAEGNYIYESKSGQTDEFRYFWMRPDSPAETHHIEFRYGSDKDLLTQLMTGKYAYWMASGVREGHEEEWKQSISLFIGENLGAKE